MQRAEADLYREFMAVFVQAIEFQSSAHGPHAGRSEEIRSVGWMLLVEALRQQHFDFPAQQLLPLIAECLFYLCVDQYDLAILIYHDHCVRRSFEQGTEFLLRPFAIGDVPEN